MNPAELDALIHAQKRDGEHDKRNCPKCHAGFMAYVGHRMFSCMKCDWPEFGEPPWPDRSNASPTPPRGSDTP